METSEILTSNDYIICFNEGQQAILKYKGETEGVYKYETSLTDHESLKQGVNIKLTIMIEQYCLSEKEKLFYGINNKK